ncbi:hypothetical protein [Candidatus Laterigemmans baculatus]|uniref:hypothetical protein n=1 Tax=Candidatus Laterigemmans baculatus TaxID=2770505 RepID=UPI0013DB0504|nr:hypothetical protein [Candidatus Laterigemmans baculatus]
MTAPLIRLLLVLSLAWGGFSAGALAEYSPTAGRPSDDLKVRHGDLEVRYGIDGRYRIGRWMPIHLRPTAESAGAADIEAAGARLEIETLDGDGVRLVQSSEVAAGADSQAITRYLPAGPLGAPLEVRLFAPDSVSTPSSASDAAVASWRTRLIRGGVPISRPWTVAVGNPLGLDAIGRNELLGTAGSIEVSKVGEAAALPDAWYGYDGVDLVVVSRSGQPVLAAMSDAQGRAVVDWVRGGGNLLLTLGESGPETLAAAGWLAELTGIEERPPVVPADPAAIESFVVARDAIRSFNTTRLPADLGTVLLAGRSNDRRSLPLVVRRSVGLGVVTIVAADLDAPPFVDWKQRDDFVERILPGFVPGRSPRNEQRSGADVRYSELAGQLRSTLDRFAGADRARFSLVAALLLIVIGVIGPLDYFLVNRWLGRPWFGWISFPLTIVLVSAAILLWRGTAVDHRVRQISVIDVEPASGLGRGFSWAQVYSGQADRVDLEIVANGAVVTEGVTEGAGTAQGRSVAATLTSPWGYAGEIFGGIQVAGEDVRLPAYAIDMRRGNEASGAETDRAAASGARLEQVPLAPLSSKGIAARWRFPFTREAAVDLRRQPGSDLLTGSFVNPLPEDLLEGVLIYRNTIFLLPTRIPSGGRIAAIEAVQAKNFRWRLNRRQAAENSTQSEPWNRADDRDLARLMEIVLFYQTAGGEQYTELSNRTLADLDLSHLLTSDRAVLMGRVAAPQATVWVDGQPLESEQVEAETYVRVVLQVETSQPDQ